MVLKVVEERHIYSTKSISLWQSSGRHGKWALRDDRYAKWTSEVSEDLSADEKTNDSDSTSETLKSEHHTKAVTEFNVLSRCC